VFTLPLPKTYIRAFHAIVEDDHQELTVVEAAGELLITLQLSFLQYLTYQGGIRAQVDGVRVKRQYRGLRIGTKILQYAIQRARSRGAHLLQLTTDKQSPEAKRFYESLGFVHSHEGLKLHL
jgi:ribosomal protein S18 acetylase RimI-like enzyme